ncbi:FAD-dependent oxidoreductase [Bacillus pacificus]
MVIRLLIHLTQFRPTYQYKQRDDLFFAGQMTGVEGYVESAASGLLQVSTLLDL